MDGHRRLAHDVTVASSNDDVIGGKRLYCAQYHRLLISTDRLITQCSYDSDIYLYSISYHRAKLASCLIYARVLLEYVIFILFSIY